MKRKIAAIFAADIAGYSRLVAEDEEETLRRLASYRQVTFETIEDAGHYSMLETPVRVAGIIEAHVEAAG